MWEIAMWEIIPFACVILIVPLFLLTYLIVRRFRPARKIRFVDFVACSASLTVIGLLILPTAPSGRRAGPRTQCKNNLKQIGLAAHNYDWQYGKLPAATIGKPASSWRVQILPNIDQQTLFDRYNFTAEWDSPANQSIAANMVQGYICPSWARRGSEYTKDQKGRHFSHYAMPTGPNTVGTGVTLREITDGTTNTILVFEACAMNLVWTEPRDVDTTRQPPGVNLPTTKGSLPGWASSDHPGGSHVLLADGSARFLSQNTSPETLKALVTIDGGETVSEF